ncbi:glycosyltransferase [Mycobacterium sp. CBMA271]|uniref:glycosyltransferase family 2 protein n=1 Tax=unclassified Mycobacteroides TaxID=2618759 RepID=UPI0012DD6B84|nr:MULTISPECIES: glycosyltransferase family 2 protein [unclassified Mycobacteroides]MUM15420.1 hypothetical protein [Mycobacteroides sp. CBMA 326]MUM21322.1 glycosyltransferase [Mycobacteroides sp. CBMA 271]
MISLILLLIAAIPSIPVGTLLIEATGSLRKVRHPENDLDSGAPRTLAVVIPARNESTGIVPTLRDITPQLVPGNRVIVVADNCSDDTAAVARRNGAEVIERADLEKIGKGYALSHAIEYLRSDPPDVVIFIDADCRVEASLVPTLARVSGQLQRPVQACFLMRAAENSPEDHKLLEFAFLLKNFIRPLGLRNLNCAVQLMGTGMAFPWEVIQSAPLATGNIVEDMKLGLDLASVGKAAYFWPSVGVTSVFPTTAEGVRGQSERWNQGHLGIMLKTAPKYLLRGIRDRNVDLLAVVLDTLVPPLFILGAAVAGVWILELVFAAFGFGYAGFILATTNVGVFLSTIIAAWLTFGRKVMPARTLLRLSTFALRKLQLFGGMAKKRGATEWVRADRTASAPPPNDS